MRPRKVGPPDHILEEMLHQRRSNLESSLSRGVSFSRRRFYEQKYPKEAYGMGTIVSMAHHTPDNGETREVSVLDPYRTAIMFGSVHSKFRKFVVINNFESNHCACLPIYTHHGTGLKRVKCPDDFVSIRDAADMDAPPAESRHPVVRAIRGPDFVGSEFIAGTSSVSLTEQTTHRYDSFAVVEGHMPEDDVKKLLTALYEVTAARHVALLLPNSSGVWESSLERKADTEDDAVEALGTTEKSTPAKSGDESELEEGEIRE